MAAEPRWRFLWHFFLLCCAAIAAGELVRWLA